MGFVCQPHFLQSPLFVAMLNLLMIGMKRIPAQFATSRVCSVLNCLDRVAMTTLSPRLSLIFSPDLLSQLPRRPGPMPNFT